MKTAVVVLAAVLAANCFGADKDKEKKQNPRVQGPRTEITVRGEADRVATEDLERTEKNGNPIVRGLRGVGRGIAGLTGWLLNTNEDIPADRERTATADKEGTPGKK
jgi:hypothetical protein